MPMANYNSVSFGNYAVIYKGNFNDELHFHYVRIVDIYKSGEMEKGRLRARLLRSEF